MHSKKACKILSILHAFSHSIASKKENILPHYTYTFFPCYSERRENVEECAAGQELLDAVTLDERQLKAAHCSQKYNLLAIKI